MKKIILLFTILTLTGCESVGRHFQQLSECNTRVDSKIPPIYVRTYVRTDTTCNSSGRASPSMLGNGQYRTSGTTECSSIPIYENIEVNAAERLALRNQCMSAKKAAFQQYSNSRDEPVKRPAVKPKSSFVNTEKNTELMNKVIAEKISQGYQIRESSDGRRFVVKNNAIYGWVSESGSYQKLRD